MNLFDMFRQKKESSDAIVPQRKIIDAEYEELGSYKNRVDELHIKQLDHHEKMAFIRHDAQVKTHQIDQITSLAKLTSMISGFTLTVTLIVIAMLGVYNANPSEKTSDSDKASPEKTHLVAEKLADSIIYQAGCILGSIGTLFIKRNIEKH